MKTRKLFALLLALTMVISLFVACGNGKEDKTSEIPSSDQSSSPVDMSNTETILSSEPSTTTPTSESIPSSEPSTAAPTSEANNDSASLIEFNNEVLFEDQTLRLELVNFYSKDVNWTDGLQNEKYITLKGTNKSASEIKINPKTFYVKDEEADVMADRTMILAGGKTATCGYMIAHRGTGTVNHIALESLDMLYDVEGSFLVVSSSGLGEATISIPEKINKNGSDNQSPSEGASLSTTTSTENIKIDGIYLDESYKDKDSDTIKLLYVFYSATSTGDTLSVDSKSMTVSIEGVTTYNSTRIKDACDYMPNHYYKDYIKKVEYGETVKFAETFEVPVAALKESRKMTFVKKQIPGTEGLIMSTDNIIFKSNVEEIAKAIDSSGYQAEAQRRADADAATVSKIRNEINGYYWDFYVNNTSYKLEFFDPDEFELTTALNTVSGKYTVKNGYIYCDNGINVVQIPWSYNNAGEFELDVTSAYSVDEG